MAALLPVRLRRPRTWGMLDNGRGGDRRVLGEGQLGVDLIAVSRVRRVFKGKVELLESVFTSEELRYCTRQRNPYRHLAARFAAKEAVVKGLGTGLAGSMSWRDIETVHGPLGEPRLVLHGEVARLAESRGLHRYVLSLTHAGDYAMAAVLFAA